MRSSLYERQSRAPRNGIGALAHYARTSIPIGLIPVFAAEAEPRRAWFARPV